MACFGFDDVDNLVAGLDGAFADLAALRAAAGSVGGSGLVGFAAVFF
jgi:hypothetical protein